jgi:hypothetical protein
LKAFANFLKVAVVGKGNDVFVVGHGGAFNADRLGNLLLSEFKLLSCGSKIFGKAHF